MDTPTCLIEAVRYFSDLAVCEEYMASIRWPRGEPCCPECESKRIGTIASRRLLRCKDCRRQFSHKVGTIFEDSPLGLDKWFVAVWAIANCKNGISSHELGRAIDVTQKTAWFMLHRIRKAMEAESFDKFDGPAEADTTYVGGAAANMHKDRKDKIIKGRGAVGKTAVHGVLQRGEGDDPSQVRACVISREDGETLIGEIRRRVEPGSEVFTDEARAYQALGSDYVHAVIDHSRAYVEGNVHTNGMENFWALLKRSLGGTYVAVAPFHLTRYVAEQVFRFNSRKGSDGDRFKAVLAQVFGRRLTWRVLCGVDGAGFMTLE
jgi:transposase-like protein